MPQVAMSLVPLLARTMMLRIRGEGSLDALQALELSIKPVSQGLRAGCPVTPGAKSPRHSDALCAGLCGIWEQRMRDRGARL